MPASASFNKHLRLLILFFCFFSVQIYAKAPVNLDKEVLLYEKTFSLSDKSIVKDSRKRAHIFYGKDQLLHARWNEKVWKVEVIDQGPHTGDDVIAMIDANDRFHIIYTESSFNENSKNEGFFKYATNASGKWKIEYLPHYCYQNASDSRMDALLDNDGFVHFFIDENEITNQTGQWVGTSVDRQYKDEGYLSYGFRRNVAATKDQQNNLYLLIGVNYSSQKCFELMTKKDNAWMKISSLNVNTSYPFFTNTLLTDQTGKMNLFFQDGQNIVHAEYQGEWKTHIIDVVSGHLQEPFDGNFTYISAVNMEDGSIQVMYQDMELSLLKVAHFDGDHWEVQVVKNVETTSKNWAGSDPKTTKVLAYSNQKNKSSYLHIENQNLVAYENFLEQTETRIVDSYAFSEAFPGQNPKAVVDQEGQLHLTYYQDECLVYACRNTMGNWHTQRIAKQTFQSNGELETGWNAIENHLTVMRDGTVNIFILTWYHLIHFKYQEGVWQKEEILKDLSFPFGLEALGDENGALQLSFCNKGLDFPWDSPKKLIFISNSCGKWHKSIVAEEKENGSFYMKKMKKVNGEILIAYANTQKEVTTTRLTAKGWTKKKLPSFGNFSELAIDFDSQGNMHLAVVSYFGGLAYWSDISGDWKEEILETDPSMHRPMITVTETQEVHISACSKTTSFIDIKGIFQDIPIDHPWETTTGNLYYAYKISKKWRKGIVDTSKKSDIHKHLFIDQNSKAGIIYYDNASHQIKLIRSTRE